jgi:hypothetical protein
MIAAVLALLPKEFPVMEKPAAKGAADSNRKQAVLNIMLSVICGTFLHFYF